MNKLLIEFMFVNCKNDNPTEAEIDGNTLFIETFMAACLGKVCLKPQYCKF